MKKNSKKVIAAIAAFALCASCFPNSDSSLLFRADTLTASAFEGGGGGAYGFMCGDNASATLDENGVLTISGTEPIADYEGKHTPVYGIDETDYTYYGYSPFYKNENIKSVIIEEGITAIGDFAFFHCPNVETISIPDSVTRIGICAFATSGIATLEIPDSVTILGSAAIGGCQNLKHLVLGSGITDLGDMPAFSSSNNLETVVLKNMEKINPGYFTAYKYLKSVYLGDGVKYIESGAFGNCIALESITIPGSVKSIGSIAFQCCNSLQEVVIEEGTEEIGLSSFGSCHALKKITIPSSMKEINFIAFLYTENVEEAYCYADPAELTINGTFVGFKENKGTMLCVPAKYYYGYKEKFSDLNATIKPIYETTDLELNETYTSTITEIDLSSFITDITDYTITPDEDTPLPSGLSFKDNIVSGTPEVSGDFTSRFNLSMDGWDFGTISLNFHIAQATPEISVTLNKTGITTDDILTEDDFTVESNVPGTVTWDGLDSPLSAGTKTLNWTFTPDDENYSTATGSVSFNVLLNADAEITGTYNAPLNDNESVLIATDSFSLYDNDGQLGLKLLFEVLSVEEMAEDWNIPSDLVHDTGEVILASKTTEEAIPALREVFNQYDRDDVITLIHELSNTSGARSWIMTYAPAGAVVLKDYVDNENAVRFELAEGSTLPDGLMLTDNMICGIPETSGDYTTTFNVYKNYYASSHIGTFELTFHIAQATPEISVTLNKSGITTDDVLTEDDFTVESNVPGTVTWDGLGSPLSEGDSVLTWTFTPDDPNYAVATGEISFSVALPDITEETKTLTLTDLQYGVTYDLSEYDCDHICGVSVVFANDADETTNGSIVLGNWVSSTFIGSATVIDKTVNIAIDQYSLPSAIDTLTINDWYNTASTLGTIESVTFYYLDDEETEIADSSVILNNADNETANRFDLSGYDYENVQSVTLVFDGIVYSGSGAIVTGEYGNIIYDFSMDRTSNYSVTIDVNRTLTDTLSFSNYYNLKDLSYIALNY